MTIENAKLYGSTAFESVQIPDTTDLQQKLLAMLLMNPKQVRLCEDKWFEGDELSIFNVIKHKVELDRTVNIDDFLVCEGLSDQAVYVFQDIIRMNDDKVLSDFSDYNVGLAIEELRKKSRLAETYCCLSSLIMAFQRGDKEDFKRSLNQISMAQGSASPEELTFFGTETRFPQARIPMTIRGVPVFEAQNYYVVMGAEKSGKSHFLAVLLSAVMYGGCEDFGIKSLLGPEDRILYLDTEQSPTDAQGICRTANLIANKPYDAPCPRLFIASTDGMSAADTMANLEQSIRKLHPAIVFIDGYAGFLDDNYQNKGAEQTMKKVRCLAREYNTSIIGIWHTVENMLGKTSAFGAAGKLSQKFGGGTMLVCSSNGIVKVSHLQSRKAKVPDLSMKMTQKVILDRTDGEPQIVDCCFRSIEDVLHSMGRDINDEDVHTYAVPECIDNDDAEIFREQNEAAEQLRKQEMRERANEPQYRNRFMKLFGTRVDESLPKKELLESYVSLSWHQDNFVPLDEPMENIDKKTRDKYCVAFRRLLDTCIRLGIACETPKKSGCYRYLLRAN